MTYTAIFYNFVFGEIGRRPHIFKLEDDLTIFELEDDLLFLKTKNNLILFKFEDDLKLSF
jgi:hypothetical protein